MKLTMAVTLDGNTYQVESTLYTIVSWERKFKRKASEMATSFGLEDIAYIAWESSKQAGINVPAMFDDFVKRCAGIDIVGAETPRPTPGGQSDTP